MCLERLFEERCVWQRGAQGVIEERAAVRGGGVFNKCMLMSEAAAMRGDARALLLFTAVFVHRSESTACKWHYCL